MRAQQRGIFLPRCVVQWFVDVAGDGCAVFALELNVFGRHQAHLFHRVVVGVRDARQLPPGTVNISLGESGVVICAAISPDLATE